MSDQERHIGCRYEVQHIDRIARLEAENVSQHRDIEEIKSILKETSKVVAQNHGILNNGLSSRIAKEISEANSVKGKSRDRILSLGLFFIAFVNLIIVVLEVT